MKFRRERLSSLIRAELSRMVERDLEFPSGVLVTLTEVEVSPGLKEAAVKFVSFPSGVEDEAKRILDSRRNEFQSRLFKRLRIISVPRIRFEFDKGAENVARVEKLIMEK